MKADQYSLSNNQVYCQTTIWCLGTSITNNTQSQCLKFKQIIYNSLLSCRLAEGLLRNTLPKFLSNSDLNSFSMSPSNTLNTLLPPILNKRCVNCKAIVEREICLA